MINNFRFLILAYTLAAILMAIAGCATPNNTSGGEVKTSFSQYEGAWFEILYPDTFTPRPSLASQSADGHDSVFFQSPDGSIELYVCAPQWGRATPDIDLVEALETLVNETSSQRGIEITRSWTIVAKDRGYERVYEEIMSIDGTTRKVFGFRYPNKSAQEKYKPIYNTFKKSLMQYAD